MSSVVKSDSAKRAVGRLAKVGKPVKTVKVSKKRVSMSTVEAARKAVGGLKGTAAREKLQKAGLLNRENKLTKLSNKSQSMLNKLNKTGGMPAAERMKRIRHNGFQSVPTKKKGCR